MADPPQRFTLVQIDFGPKDAGLALAGGENAAQRKNTKTGRLDHIAFACTGLKQMKAKLKKQNIEYEERVLPRDRQTQLFLRDPDGIAVELNFPSHETPAAA